MSSSGAELRLITQRFLRSGVRPRHSSASSGADSSASVNTSSVQVRPAVSVALGALLHDAGEDGRIEDIRHRFGNSVAEIVQGCTDAVTIPKPPWQTRKEDYIARVSKSSASVQLVFASDKLHNARAILRDFRKHGDAVWSRFTGGKDCTLRYYRALVTVFRLGGDSELTDELDKVVTEIVQIASSP